MTDVLWNGCKCVEAAFEIVAIVKESSAGSVGEFGHDVFVENHGGGVKFVILFALRRKNYGLVLLRPTLWSTNPAHPGR